MASRDPVPKGSVTTVAFEPEGAEIHGTERGPLFKFTEAISFVVNCETQEEIDEMWAKLSAASPAEMMTDPDPARSERVMKALLQMKKLDIGGLRAAVEGR
jgi:predicted 3-demethylubiquinone-9 3-methyltransferase (glyoxalase superfamily)